MVASSFSSVCRQMKQSIIIPAYNEAKRIGATLQSLVEYAKEGGLEANAFEVIVVCDGCRDNTESVAGGFEGQLPLRVVSYPANQGKGYAVKHGISLSSGDIVMFMDADGSTPVRELSRLSGPVRLGYADIVVGSRRVKGAKLAVRQPLLRQLLGHLFSLHTFLVLGIRVLDTQCGFKVFRGSVARELFPQLRSHGFVFDLDVLAMAEERHLRVLERGVEWRDVGGSTVHPLRDGVRMLRGAWQIRSRLQRHRRIKAQEAEAELMLTSCRAD